jgi:hypothetical protein
MLNLSDSMADALVTAHLDMHTLFPVTQCQAMHSRSRVT